MFSEHFHTFLDFSSENWEFITTLLETSDSVNCSNIVNLISSLQNKLWDNKEFSILKSPDFDIEEFIDYFKWAVPHILSLPILFSEGFTPFFNENIIRLSKHHCLSLLCALFFSCTNRFHSFLSSREEAKYRCMLTYFKIMKSEPEEKQRSEFLTIERKVLFPKLEVDHWKNCQLPLRSLYIEKVKKIEDFDDSFLKVDFANQYIGGGVLHYGCVQEEILFSIYPEHLISMLFCSVMKKNEAIALNGAIRVANYSGYGWGFKFASEYTAPQDPSLNTYVAIDALIFPPPNYQFSEKGVCREINKAFIGFSRCCTETQETLNPVVTGKWGCGEFGGFAPLKTMLMWIAASAAGRDMYMTTFGDKSLEIAEEVTQLYQGRPICELFELVVENENWDLLEHLVEIRKNPGSERFKPKEKEEFKIRLPEGVVKKKQNH